MNYAAASTAQRCTAAAAAATTCELFIYLELLRREAFRHTYLHVTPTASDIETCAQTTKCHGQCTNVIVKR